MRTSKRPRRYVASHWVALGRPVLRYSKSRDAYIARLIGHRWGPVLKLDRRHGVALDGIASERRGSHARTA
jgi:hypothetical protein